MRRLLAIGAVAGLLVSCSSSRHSSQPAPATATTIATPANLRTVSVAPAGDAIDGFGASGAWWPNDLIHFPVSVQKSVSDMLFSEQGIALSGYRYNIGGGGVGVTDPARAPHQEPDDAAGRTFLVAASDAKVPILTGFVNSAPPQFTTNGKSCGGELKPGSEAAYADYLTGIVTQLHDRDHITLNYVSPMNEPDDSFPGCGQEGMKVPVSQRARVVQTLGAALAPDAPYARVIADETTADAILADEAPQWLAVPGTTKYLAAIAHHTYDFPNDALRRLLPPVVQRFSRPTWMTEICCYKGSGGVATSQGAQFDPTITQGLWVVDQIYDDLVIARDRAWYWWTAVSPKLGCDPKANLSCVACVNPNGQNDGLLYYDEKYATDGNTNIYTTKRFYAFGQFSRYVRPGAVRHDVTGTPAGVRVMAFEAGGNWTVVAWNEGRGPATFGVPLPGSLQPREARVTSNTAELATAPLPVRAANGAWVLSVATQSIVTFTFGA